MICLQNSSEVVPTTPIQRFYLFLLYLKLLFPTSLVPLPWSRGHLCDWVIFLLFDLLYLNPLQSPLLDARSFFSRTCVPGVCLHITHSHQKVSPFNSWLSESLSLEILSLVSGTHNFKIKHIIFSQKCAFSP